MCSLKIAHCIKLELLCKNGLFVIRRNCEVHFHFITDLWIIHVPTPNFLSPVSEVRVCLPVGCVLFVLFFLNENYYYCVIYSYEANRTFVCFFLYLTCNRLPKIASFQNLGGYLIPPPPFKKNPSKQTLLPMANKCQKGGICLAFFLICLICGGRDMCVCVRACTAA